MTGTGFIVTDNDWACSNDVSWDMYSDPIRDPVTGKTVQIRKTQTLTFKNSFTGRGKISEDAEVDCAFKIDETNEVLAFKGRVRSAGALTIINILTKKENIKEILSKITQN